MEGVIAFKQHDRNNDGVLSIEEFEQIAHRLLDTGAVSNNYGNIDLLEFVFKYILIVNC